MKGRDSPQSDPRRSNGLKSRFCLEMPEPFASHMKEGKSDIRAIRFCSERRPIFQKRGDKLRGKRDLIVSYLFLSDEFDHRQKQDWLMGRKPFRAVYSQPRESLGIEMDILFHVECKQGAVLFPTDSDEAGSSLLTNGYPSWLSAGACPRVSLRLALQFALKIS